MKVNRLRPVVGALVAAATLTAVLTGCEKGGSAAGETAASAGAAKSAGTPAGPTAGATAEPAGSVGTGTSTGTPTGTAAGAVKAKPSSATTTAPAAPAASASCADAPPTPDDYDPDEFALFRIEELPADTGKVNLVIQHGAWGCPDADTDGAPFVVSGEDSRWALDQAAYVTAVTPITDSTENRRIGVQELIDWVDAHPDSGLVFRYETGDDGAIHRLEQVFTP
ncbi:hypothetical protein [Streptomyces sp. DSM 15324]|uniref:hypothetical protein n=1 Tax=Streptomyces sp. DSM 15324 TaxID=1739111 RepID=UPI0007467B01|nr:hypothetical protein [Streptomyces sp. DSM 15324]KUO08722.1 hypothetical protein AQJ58_29120 [Streptomyces sp. DSM 15324]